MKVDEKAFERAMRKLAKALAEDSPEQAARDHAKLPKATDARVGDTVAVILRGAKQRGSK